MFILDLRQNLPADFSLPSFPSKKVDDHTLEVVVDKNQDMNALFAALSEQGIEVASMRNKSNRLEEMFVSLLSESVEGASHE